MAIVKDTESFIRAARAIHGERYDYSRTVWDGSQSPITIVCRVCGPFVLKHAECHYRKRKPCGCKKCGLRKIKTCECGYRGYGTKAFPANAGGKCKSCWNAIQTRKRQVAHDLLSRPCETCGRPIGSTDSRKVVCSNSCRYKRSRKEKVVVDCCVCGKGVQRYKKALETGSKFACSNECQRVWAGMRGAGILAKVGSDRWKSSQDKAKKEWYRKQSKKRRDQNRFYLGILRRLSAIKAGDDSTGEKCLWTKAISARLKGAMHRVSIRVNAKTEKKKQGITQAIQKIKSERKWFELSDWQKKITNRLSNQKARRNRKHVAKVKIRNAAKEDRGVGFQMCFDWLAD